MKRTRYMFARSWSNAHVKKLFIVIMFLRQRSIVEDRQSVLRQRSKVEDREYSSWKWITTELSFQYLIFDLTLLRQTSVERYSSTIDFERYSSTIDSYAIKLSYAYRYVSRYMTVSWSSWSSDYEYTVHEDDCNMIRRITWCQIDMIHVNRISLYKIFFRVKCFLRNRNWVAPFSLRIRCFFLYHWIRIENYILFKIETCHVSVNSSIMISKYLIWSWNLEKTCSDRISELLRETRDEDETDLTFFDSVDTRGIHRI